MVRISNRELCYRCNEVIHIDDWGGINKEGFFHEDCTKAKMRAEANNARD